MSEMVEKVARKLCELQDGDPDYCASVPNHPLWRQCVEFARAAAEAMREPSPAMIAAAWTVFDRHPHKRLGPGPGFKEAIAAAFDAALKE